MRIAVPLTVAASLTILVACKKEATPSETTVASTTTGSMNPAGPTATPAPTTNDDKIKNAMSAAPDSIASAATIMDWPATETGQPTRLRAGTNGWVCYPTSPAPKGVVGQDPVCMDPGFQKLIAAYMSKKPPKLTTVGIAYMLQGDRGSSISDPYATETAKPADWVVEGPHLMVVPPNAASLASLPGKPGGGVPWVMWKGTPYAHIMVPVKG